VFVSYVHVLSAAFLMGRAVGPAQHAGHPPRRARRLAPHSRLRNRLRHRRSNPLLSLLGGHYLFSDLANPTLQTVLAAGGVIVLLPLGIYFLVRTVKEPLRAYASARRQWDETPSPRIWSPESLTAPP
jgi:hypothetical protein